MLRKNDEILMVLSIFYALLWANGHQKEPTLALLDAEYKPGFLNGYAPEYAIINSELIGNIIISMSHIENSTINWNNVEKMNVCNNIAIEDHRNSKTFEKEIKEYGVERVTQINIQLKHEWEKEVESLLNDNDIHTNDIETDKLFNENRKDRITNEDVAESLLEKIEDLEDYYKRLFGDLYYNQLMELLNKSRSISTIEILNFIEDHKNKRISF